ncbi:hypothetical protein [Dyadobacter sp. CY323]|uniref:hypothetical protein n=1 Tax=Dyadobacter sp. CY323 TaxID=2907302 RepID=UPI001F449C01|nr:hypothetical protein [Dyadobacter sp. CY323]MCE6992926.1 hypothetical protein [Dyadobacter sp. CY323]
MDTLPHSDEPEDSALNQLHIAYGRKVKELLSQSDAETWIEDLWDMYTGFTLSARKLGMIREVTIGLFLSKSLCFSFRMLGR